MFSFNAHLAVKNIWCGLRIQTSKTSFGHTIQYYLSTLCRSSLPEFYSFKIYFDSVKRHKLDDPVKGQYLLVLHTPSLHMFGLASTMTVSSSFRSTKVQFIFENMPEIPAWSSYLQDSMLTAAFLCILIWSTAISKLI